MSYGIGQFRRPQINSYITQSKNNVTIAQQDTVSGGTNFKDTCGNLTNMKMNNQNCYYIRIGIKKLETPQDFYLKIRNKITTQDNEQIIDQFSIPSGKTEETAYIETIISPNAADYDQILFQLKRTTADYQTPTGRKMSVTIQSFGTLVDVMEEIRKQHAGLKQLVKIGIQGPPSMLFAINREPIRLGKTGIYELNVDGIYINQLHFMPKTIKENEMEYFIVDYQY